MAREVIKPSTSSMTSSHLSGSIPKATASRLPVKTKRAVLGERIENFDHSTPRQHLVKPVKSVIKPRVSATKLKPIPRISTTSDQATPARTVTYALSPAQSTSSSPAGANVSRPGFTPHPRRSSVGLSQLINDQSLLMDTTQGFPDSDTDASEADEPVAGNMPARRGVMGPGRLMTPANSQESQELSRSQGTFRQEASPRRLAMRLPTPPSSQPTTDNEAVLSRTLVRARPAPTPPRKAATPSIRLNGVSAPASPTSDVSPNPRRKKTPRVDEAGPSRLRSPFELEAPGSDASPRHPRDRLEVVIGRSPRASTPTDKPKPSAQTAKRGRLSTKTPSASHPLSQSTNSQPGRARKAPATAPPANRHKSTPVTTRKRPPPRTSLPLAKSSRAPRLSVRNTSRKSVTPAELKAMAGLLPEPVEQGSPSDDPLLLVDDDQDYSSKTPTTARPSRAGSSKGSSSTARIIDFDAAITQGSSRSNRSREEAVTEYEIPIQGSEPEYDHSGQDYGFDWGGDSDDEDGQMGNDTFVHTANAGARSRSTVGLDLIARPTPVEEEEEAPAPSSSRPPSPFLARVSQSQQESSRRPSPFLSAGSESPRVAEVELEQAPSPARHVPSPRVERSPFHSRMYSTSPMPTPGAAGSPVPSITFDSYPDAAASSSPIQPLPELPVHHFTEQYDAPSPGRGPVPATSLSAASPQLGQSPVHSRLATASPRFALSSAVPACEADALNMGLASPSARPLSAAACPVSMRSRSSTPILRDEEVRASPAVSRHSSPRAIFSPAVSSKLDSSPARASSATPRTHYVETLLDSKKDVNGRSGTNDDASLSPARSRTSTPRAFPARSTVSCATPASGTAEPLSPVSLALDRISQGIPWSADQLVPGTPSMLGLFMPDQADAQSTPHAHMHQFEPDTPASCTEANELYSTTPSAAVPTALAPFSSPRGSPAALPDLEPEEEEEDTLGEPDAEDEDKENQSPLQIESTTPSASPPIEIKHAASPVYSFTFSPRIASPLRIAHRISPTPGPAPLATSAITTSLTVAGRDRTASYSPIPPVESLNDRFGDLVHEHGHVALEEEEECASGDVTLEGNSADWSLSDGELELGKEDEQERAIASAAEVEGDVPEVDSLAVNFEEQDTTPEVQELQAHAAESGAEEYDTKAYGALEEENADDDIKSETALTTNMHDTDASLEQDDLSEQGSEAEEGASSDTLADPAGFESSFEDGEEASEPASPVESEKHASPARVPPSGSEKIILRLVDRGIVKIEQDEETAVSSFTPHALPQNSLVDVSLDTSVRSTTPAYDPPQITAMAAGVVSPTPKSPANVSLYPQLPSTPVFAPLPEFTSSTPLGSPPASLRLGQSDQAASPRYEDAVIKSPAGPSTRPRSRLSRRISEAPPTPEEQEDDADASVRIRSASALGQEPDDADNSMRSVVEVSSFDPKAAARAAAILKLNHAYIEHGDITKLGESSRPESPRRRSFHSARLDKLDASRRDDKTDLLYEAELEIVSTRRSRSRSMSRFRGISEAATELPLPGAWNGTPKRKRSGLSQAPLQSLNEDQHTTPTWGVSQWKKLEKVFRAEREIWVTERQVKAMPGGFIGWARMSTFGPAAPVATVWDPMRVVDRFMDEQNIRQEDRVGDWSVEILKTRVEALERHAEHRKIKGKEQETEKGIEDRSPKKIKTAVEAIEASTPTAAPSTVRKLFGWVLPGSARKSTGVAPSANDTPLAKKVDGRGKGRAENTDGPTEEWNPPMSQIGGSVSIPLGPTFDVEPTIPLHPSSPAWKAARSRPAPVEQARPTPRTLSAILAESSSTSFNIGASSSATAAGTRLSFSQKSAALDALFGGASTSTSVSASQARAVRVPTVKRISSVKDMVKSFEESGAFEKAVKGPRGA